MSLGKRPRGPMRRTTSMTEITFDLSSGVDAPTVQSNSKDSQKMGLENSTRKQTDGFDTRYLSMVSPRNHPRRNSAEFLETPPFLRACSLCKRRLGTGRDIYMYRSYFYLTFYCFVGVHDLGFFLFLFLFSFYTKTSIPH